jgi:alanyl-tRNA synthetase
VILLASVEGENVELISMADDTAIKKGVSAGKIMKEMCAILGGGGGGRPALAQGGGKGPELLEKVFSSLPAVVEAQIAK